MKQAETRALELVASALSEEYGVRVLASGFRVSVKRDANNMPVITIPAVPLQDENYRLLIRGYVDHAVGHVRFGADERLENEVLDDPRIAGALKAIVSIYEDIRIDRQMGECFFGCGRNLRKLALYLYANPDIPNAEDVLEKLRTGIMSPRQLPWHIWQTALQYIIYYTRACQLPQLEKYMNNWRDALDKLAPGLAPELLPILDEMLAHGESVEANLDHARETVLTIRNWLETHLTDIPSSWQEACFNELPWLMRNGGEIRELADMGNLAAVKLDELMQELMDPSQTLVETQWHKRNSHIWQTRLQPLDEDERLEALKAAAKMSAQMQALLQSHMLNREGPFRQGKLHTRNLHKLFIGRDDLFKRQTERREVNTEIVCCIDMSGSMRFDNKASMASRSLYAVAECLSHIQGLKLNIMGFFDNNMVEMHIAGAPIDNRMKMVPDGGTLCGAALRAAARLFSHERKKRRIIIMITDGDANDPEYFQEAIADLGNAGIEILGIGIHDTHILEYLPVQKCCVLNDLGELAGSILGMLRKKLGVRA